MNRFVAFLVLCFICTASVCLAKRSAPKKVAPVFTAMLRIEAPLDDGWTARLQGFDRTDGHLVWTVIVFENKIRRELEEDVQWRFISGLKIVGNAVEVAVEGGARYRVILSSQKVERISASRQESAAQTFAPS